MLQKMFKRHRKAVPSNVKVDRKLIKENVFNKELQIDTDSLSCFWSQGSTMVPKACQKPPKTLPKEIQSEVEMRRDEKIRPGPSQMSILECLGERVGAF